MKDELFYKDVGRLCLCFRKSKGEVVLFKVFLNEQNQTEDIKTFPYEREIEMARKEAYDYFGLKYRKRPSRR